MEVTSENYVVRVAIDFKELHRALSNAIVALLSVGEATSERLEDIMALRSLRNDMMEVVKSRAVESNMTAEMLEKSYAGVKSTMMQAGFSEEEIDKVHAQTEQTASKYGMTYEHIVELGAAAFHERIRAAGMDPDEVSEQLNRAFGARDQEKVQRILDRVFKATGVQP